MNVQDRSGAFDLNKYGVGQPVRRTEDPVLVQGQGRYTDDVNLPGQAYAVFVRSRHGHGIIKGIDTGGREGDARRARRLHRRGPRRLRHDEMRGAVQEPRRLGDEEAAAPLAARPTRCASSAIRSRCVVAETHGAGEGRGRSGRARHRAAARRHQGERSRQARRAAALRRRARQRRARLSLRRSREGRGGVRQGRARHQADARQQPRRRQRDGAARRDRVVRQGERALHAQHRLPGRVRHEGPARRYPRRARPTRCTC